MNGPWGCRSNGDRCVVAIYLVGGAVRDQLLQLPDSDRDWVVVGATPDWLLEQGFLPVGKDFPVFLHPQTKEEYALARIERKTGQGYKGFDCFFSPSVTLEEDLSRRDLTINAIAQRSDGTLVDPFGGIQDIAHRTLRHVSMAFIEDPVRILRVARFYARFKPLGFKVAEETLALMQRMVTLRELEHVTTERIWSETERALAEPYPWGFFEILEEVGALQWMAPELSALKGVPQPAAHHPEGDVWTHTKMTLASAALLSSEPIVRFAALLHDLGKAQTPPSEWPRHLKHEWRGMALVDRVADRWQVPKAYRELAKLVTAHHLLAHRIQALHPSTVWNFLKQLDVVRKQARLSQFIAAVTADARGRLGREDAAYPQADWLMAYAQAFSAVRITEAEVSEPRSAAAWGEALKRKQMKALRAVKQQLSKHPPVP